MNKKDFNVGQIVCVKQFSTNWGRKEELQEWKITKIGRIYVTAIRIDLNSIERQFSIETGYEKDSNDYRLYLSKQHIEDLEEVYKLKEWFKNNFNNYSNTSKYSLDALRNAKKILEDSVK